MKLHYDAETERFREELAAWPELRERYLADEQTYEVRGREISVQNRVHTLAGTPLPDAE